jgi:hypothetical protein
VIRGQDVVDAVRQGDAMDRVEIREQLKEGVE